MSAIKALAEKRNRQVGEWAVTSGMNGIEVIDPEATKDPIGLFISLLDQLAGIKTPTLFILKDFPGLLNDPVTVRYIRDLVAALEKTPHNVIFLSPSFSVPADLEKQVVILDWPLPDVAELEKILSRVERNIPDEIPVTLNGNREAVVKSLLGLTAFEAESALLSAVATTGELGDSVITHVVKEKAQIIRKSGVSHRQQRVADPGIGFAPPGGGVSPSRRRVLPRLPFRLGAGLRRPHRPDHFHRGGNRTPAWGRCSPGPTSPPR